MDPRSASWTPTELELRSASWTPTELAEDERDVGGGVADVPAARPLIVHVSDVSVAPTDVDPVSEDDDVSTTIATTPAHVQSPAFDPVVELPLVEDDTEWVDEFGRMNGTPSNFNYYDDELPPRQRTPCVSRPRVRSRSRACGRSSAASERPAAVRVRSSAFGSGVFIAHGSEFEAAYRVVSLRIRHIIATGWAFYIGITENPGLRWANEHAHRWDFLEILAEAPTSYTTASLEVRLLSDFLHVFTCENNSPGGESASGGSPHFCYVVVRCNGLLRRRGRGR